MKGSLKENWPVILAVAATVFVGALAVGVVGDIRQKVAARASLGAAPAVMPRCEEDAPACEPGVTEQRSDRVADDAEAAQLVQCRPPQKALTLPEIIHDVDLRLKALEKAQERLETIQGHAIGELAKQAEACAKAECKCKPAKACACGKKAACPGCAGQCCGCCPCGCKAAKEKCTCHNPGGCSDRCTCGCKE